jgi:hypothetical protein
MCRMVIWKIKFQLILQTTYQNPLQVNQIFKPKNNYHAKLQENMVRICYSLSGDIVSNHDSEARKKRK